MAEAEKPRCGAFTSQLSPRESVRSVLPEHFLLLHPTSISRDLRRQLGTSNWRDQCPSTSASHGTAFAHTGDISGYGYQLCPTHCLKHRALSRAAPPSQPMNDDGATQANNQPLAVPCSRPESQVFARLSFASHNRKNLVFTASLLAGGRVTCDGATLMDLSTGYIYVCTPFSG